MACLLVAAHVPDVDILFAATGGLSYLEHHRTWSHSLIGAAGLGAAVGAVFWKRAQRRPPDPASAFPLRRFLLIGSLGGLSHALLDWLNPYGVQILWPFRRTWYALDWFALIDPWVLAILALGLALPLLFRLIAEEIGARRSETGGRWGAGLALAACSLLALGRATLHADAVAKLERRQYRNRAPLRVGAFPSPLNPFRWNGVIETDVSYELVPVTLLGEEQELRASSTHYKPASSPVLEAALASPTGQLFLDWARFPLATVIPTPDGWQVGWRDLRYAQEAPRVRVFSVWMELDREPRMRGERFLWGTGPPPE
jgi:inner membrane protein